MLDTTLCDKACQRLATGRWFSLSTPVSSTNKTDRHDIAEIYCVFFPYVSEREVRHGYMGGGGRVFFANYTLILSYIHPIFSLNKYTIFLYNFCQKWLDILMVIGLTINFAISAYQN